MNHRRKKLRLQERCVGQMISDMISANQRLCEAFPGKLMQAFENEVCSGNVHCLRMSVSFARQVGFSDMPLAEDMPNTLIVNA